jgi:hypothetical protein
LEFGGVGVLDPFISEGSRANRNTILTMERLFSPCTRYRDMLELLGVRRHQSELLRELNLDVSTEEFLSAERAFTYADLYAMLGNGETVAWLTLHAAVAREGGRAPIWLSSEDDDNDDIVYKFSFNVDGTDIFAVARSSEALSEIIDVVLRLVAANARDVYELTLWNAGLDDEVLFFNAPSLAHLVEQCQNLKALTLQELVCLNEDHFRVLGAMSRPGLEIVLKYCKFTSAGASGFAEVLGRNQGPTVLEDCNIANSVLADGLRGNSRLKSLSSCLFTNSEDGNRQLLAIAGALRENKGLVDLNLRYNWRASDETWNAVCNYLKTHPTLQVLNLRSIQRFGEAPMPPAVLKSQIQALAEMLKVNTSIYTIHLDPHYNEHELFRRTIIPYLVTNRLRPRLLAIQKTRPIAYRTKVLGRALLAVRTDVNSFWMLLSGNAEVAFASTTATTTLVANLPTPATVGANFTANAAPVATATDSATTASNVIVPAAGPKRKACP